MKKIKAGIIGGAGYTGGEAVRLLIRHPDVELTFVHSNSNSGKYLYEVHVDLLGDTTMRFTADFSTDVDVLLLCVGHGDARKFLEERPIPPSVRIIDLSQDFRLAPGNGIDGRTFVYGLPETNREAIAAAKNIANPGCFATCLQLGLLPLAAKGLLTADVHVTATTGSTGAGQSLSSTSHFSWRANNLSVYKAFGHQHLHEIGQTVRRLSPDFDGTINFVPYRGDFTRGIIASIYTDCPLSLDEARALYEEFYKNAEFTRVSDANISLKQVVNTNKCFLHLEKHGDKLLIISCIDNLLKGASGQAVQNLNLMFGLNERAGLDLKPVAF
ncbi:MAG: N-acetyl-gamma-glutamyl-phosphate reductase [Rikenellaceae bacterium]|jgi:N-acetyl-gamma-glutamyl-phosphate reductase|nr:N-acetyl-gamma-glutamyl-phosphate reductase [Rikenellaceae bacterium]